VLQPFRNNPKNYGYDLPSAAYYPKGKRLSAGEMLALKVKNSGNELITYCDIGPGAGWALLNAACIPQWEGRIETVGIGPVKYAQETELENAPQNSNTMFDLLLNKGVQLFDGSVVNLDKMAVPDFDVVTMCNVLQYINAYPQWDVIRKIYRHTKPGGLIYLNGFGRYANFGKGIENSFFSDEVFFKINSEWQQYFAALAEIGCEVQTQNDNYERRSHGELVIIKNCEGAIPNAVGNIKRPKENRFYREEELPTHASRLNLETTLAGRTIQWLKRGFTT